MAEVGALTVLTVALVAFVLAGIAQSVTGFGSSLVAAPLLAMVAGAGTTVVAVTLVSLVLTGWAGVRERHHVDVGLARTTGIAGLLGIPVGLVLLSTASDTVLGVLMAVVVLGALVIVASPLRLPARPMSLWGAGLTSGVLLSSTGMNGPPLVLAMDSQRLTPRRFRGTLQVVLCGQDLAAVIGFVVIGSIDSTALLATAAGVVASPVGWLLGDRVFHRIPAHVFGRVLLLGLAVSALTLGVTHLMQA